MHDTDAIMACAMNWGTRPGHIMNFVNLQMKWRQLICPLCGAQRWRGFRSKSHLRKTWVIVYEAHNAKVERGGLHNTDYRHLAWKKRLDPRDF